MVIQQVPSTGGWSGVQPPPPKQEPPKPKKKHSPLPVVAVQCIACGVFLLFALLLRVAGGEPYEQLRSRFQAALMSNDLLGTLAELWDGDPMTLESDPVEKDTVSAAGLLPPAGTVAVGVRVNRPAACPLSQGNLTSGYGYRINPTGEGVQFHRGVDIAAPAGNAIAAMYDGCVSEAGESESLGRYVRLTHGDGLEVLYAHCSAILASEGTAVKAGEPVAQVGSTGDSTGNHVHIQVSVDGIVYNPAGIVPLQRYA